MRRVVPTQKGICPPGPRRPLKEDEKNYDYTERNQRGGGGQISSDQQTCLLGRKLMQEDSSLPACERVRGRVTGALWQFGGLPEGRHWNNSLAENQG